MLVGLGKRKIITWLNKKRKWLNMNEFQPSFEYNEGTGHVLGSETSKMHEQYEMKQAATLQQRIIDLCHANGKLGLTSEEAEMLTGKKHQSVSSSIRNLELAGRLVKTVQVRKNQHAYVTVENVKYLNNPEEDTLEPNPRRISWKKKYDELWEEHQLLQEEFKKLSQPRFDNKITTGWIPETT